MKLQLDRFDSPLGEIAVVVNERALCTLDFADCDDRMQALLVRRYGDIDLAPTQNAGGIRERIDAYFAGDRRALDGIEVETRGTPFQETVWRALRGIGYGETASYGELAARIGRPTASRAVGMANGQNPVALVIPCHRVIGADGSLTGYAGGIERKRWLLSHEGAIAPAGDAATSQRSLAFA